VKQKGTELGRLQAKLNELLQDVRVLDQARSALQKSTPLTADMDDKYERSQHACEQVAKYGTELAELRAELEAKKSELGAVRSLLMDAKNGWAKSRAAAETLRT